MAQSIFESRINDVISPAIESMGYEVVRVKIIDGERKKLQVIAEKPNYGKLTIDDCSKISRSISVILDVENQMLEKYDLEVGSTGIDRPLIKLKDFEYFAGYTIKIVFAKLVNGSRRFRGTVIKLSENDDIIFRAENTKEDMLIEFDNIESAKLIITDELLKKSINN